LFPEARPRGTTPRVGNRCIVADGSEARGDTVAPRGQETHGIMLPLASLLLTPDYGDELWALPAHDSVSASGKKICVQTHRLRPDAPGAWDTLDAPWQPTYRSQCKTHRQSEFGRSSPRHHAPGCSAPRHLLTGQSVAGHFRSGRMVSGHFPSGRTVSGHFPSGRTVSGHFPSGRSHVRAFSFWTQPCQGIFLLDAAVSGHFPSGRSCVRANGIRTAHVMAPWLRWLSRHGTS